MRQRRMFDLAIVDQDLFQTMSLGSKYLYFELGLRADDYGFVANPKAIIKMVGTAENDFEILAERGYVKIFRSGLIVITDWNINNTLTKKRPTIFLDELNQLKITVSKKYEFKSKEELLLNSGDVTENLDVNDEIIETVAKDITNDKKFVIVGDMLKCVELLNAVGISATSAKGRKLGKECTLEEIQDGIQYAKAHIPNNCKNMEGWIISCIEQQHAKKNNLKKQCPDCHGSGKIQIIEDDPDKDDGSKVGYMSACPKCKGTGLLK